MHNVKKAIIPVAGLSTRVYPMNKITKKEFLPIYDSDGIVKPTILKILEDVYDAGIREIYLIIKKEDKPIYDQLFKAVDNSVYKKISEENRKYDKKIENIGKYITYIVQEESLGFAHAVYTARKYIKDDPCILLLGDTFYESYEKSNLVEQLLEFYDHYPYPVIALMDIKEDELKNYGISFGKWIDPDQKVLNIEKITEKPSIEYARKNLLMDEKFLGNVGEWILTKPVFDAIEKGLKTNTMENEYQVMDALQDVLNTTKVLGLKVNGISYDIGNIDSFVKNFDYRRRK